VTTVAANLSIVAARGGHQRVLLVDANIRRAQIAKLLHITGIGGLTDVLGGTSMVGDCVQMSSIDSLSVLPAGSRDRALGADFGVSDVVALLDELRSEFDLIIFDLPETNELSECYAFSQALDGLFLVIEAGRVDARNARRATQRFAHCHVHLLGAIYNKHT
jgi:Mrp family chromosome partitioning ATPase